ncbi:MAG TPA: bifunctional hydroxymethylpyrimidine kinase/phosphomethylpyrimidine kinase [Actinomycetota bacterium]|nr:bifunctional hydroxymethylpyrimidine kinase/phosphomethylpyrimidine kinase [Actinomycetota bacterium]
MISRALTIAGSDSGGGAGIQADLKTFMAMGVHGMSAITALTAQNTVGVSGVHEVPPDFVRAQLDAVMQDIGADAAKTGMLASAPIVEAVAAAVSELRIPNLVCDPVSVSKHGDPLLHPAAVEALRRTLIPLATVVTPNLPEAEALLGRPLGSMTPDEDAARELAALGAKWVLLKGGHLGSESAIDLLTDGRRVIRYESPRIPTKHTHGTGCVLAAAITAGLAKGLDVADAVGLAKHFVTRAIEAHLEIGSGIGPVNPAFEAG